MTGANIAFSKIPLKQEIGSEAVKGHCTRKVPLKSPEKCVYKEVKMGIYNMQNSLIKLLVVHKKGTKFQRS